MSLVTGYNGNIRCGLLSLVIMFSPKTLSAPISSASTPLLMTDSVLKVALISLSTDVNNEEQETEYEYSRQLSECLDNYISAMIPKNVSNNMIVDGAMKVCKPYSEKINQQVNSAINNSPDYTSQQKTQALQQATVLARQADQQVRKLLLEQLNRQR